MVVKFEGCRLEVLYACAPVIKYPVDDAYGIEWSAGPVERIDTEKLHAKYVVSGRGTLRRPVFRGDISQLAGCEGATHFVTAFDLGAFARGDRDEARVEAACTGDRARDAAACTHPIRLTLEPITERKPSEFTVVDPNKVNEVAALHLNEASSALDGTSCLRELDAYDRAGVAPAQLSTDPRSLPSSVRAECLMRSGRCAEGKRLKRKVYEMHWHLEPSDPLIEVEVAEDARWYCNCRSYPCGPWRGR